MSYTVRRPIAENMDHEGVVISRHRTLAGAQKALEGQRKGARKQGGYSQDYVYCEKTKTRAQLKRED